MARDEFHDQYPEFNKVDEDMIHHKARSSAESSESASGAVEAASAPARIGILSQTAILPATLLTGLTLGAGLVLSGVPGVDLGADPSAWFATPTSSTETLRPFGSSSAAPTAASSVSVSPSDSSSVSRVSQRR